MRPSIDPQPVPPPKDSSVLSVVAPAGIGLLVGAGVGILLGRTWLAPKPPAATRLNPGGGLKDAFLQDNNVIDAPGLGKGGWSASPAGTPKVSEAGVGDDSTKYGLSPNGTAAHYGNAISEEDLVRAAWRARQAVAAAQDEVDTAQGRVNELMPLCEGALQSNERRAPGFLREATNVLHGGTSRSAYLTLAYIRDLYAPGNAPICADLVNAIYALDGAVQRLAAAQRDLADAEARVGSSATADAARQRELAAQLEFARAQAELARQREAAQGGPRPPPETPVPNVILTDFDACQRAFAALTIAQQGRVADEMLRYFGFSGYVQVEGDAALGARLREVSQAARAKVGSTTLQPKMVNARLRALRVALSAAGQDRRDAFCQLVADAPRTFKPGGALDPLSMSFPLRR